MIACDAPGPEGLRCDLPEHRGRHGRSFPGGVEVTWHCGAPDVGVIWPMALREGLAALGSVLHEHGAALCFDCGGRGYYLDGEACACNRGAR